MNAIRYGFLWPLFGMCGLGWLLKNGLLLTATLIGVLAFVAAATWYAHEELSAERVKRDRKAARQINDATINLMKPPQ